MKPFVVSVSGEKDHGKTTLARMLADFIVHDFAIDVHIEHLAAPMYQMMAIFTNDPDFLDDPEQAKFKTYAFENGTWTGTELLQDVAQRYARDYFGKDTWARLWRERVMAHGEDSIVFIPDARMPEERAFCDMGIWISAPGVVTKQNTNHETERHLGTMKDMAEVHVTRMDTTYDPSLRDIVSKIMVKYASRSMSTSPPVPEPQEISNLASLEHEMAHMAYMGSLIDGCFFTDPSIENFVAKTPAELLGIFERKKKHIVQYYSGKEAEIARRLAMESMFGDRHIDFHQMGSQDMANHAYALDYWANRVKECGLSAKADEFEKLIRAYAENPGEKTKEQCIQMIMDNCGITRSAALVIVP